MKYRLDVPKRLTNTISKLVLVPTSGVHTLNGQVYHNYFLMRVNFQDGQVDYLYWESIIKEFLKYENITIEEQPCKVCDGFMGCDAWIIRFEKTCRFENLKPSEMDHNALHINML